jgi:hypothetical protein
VELVCGDGDRILREAGITKAGHRAKIRHTALEDSKHPSFFGANGSATSNRRDTIGRGATPSLPSPCATCEGRRSASRGRSVSVSVGRDDSGWLSPRYGSATARRDWAAPRSTSAGPGPRASMATTPRALLSRDGAGAHVHPRLLLDSPRNSSDDELLVHGRASLRSLTRRKKKRLLRSSGGATGVRSRTPRASGRGRGRAGNARIRTLAADERKLQEFMREYIYSPHIL